MTGIMLGAGLYPMLLAAQDPRGRMLPDLRGIGAERARLDDGIAGLEVEIAHRRERPGDPDSAGLRGGDDAAGAGGCDVREEAEGRGRRELGQTFDLLAGPALQVSADEQPPARLLAEVVRQRADGLHRAPEENEPADTGSKRGVDLGALVVEAAAPPSQGREHQASERRGHAGVM